ncbi:MAG: hypothetical protein AAF367_11165 [Pseudomonadota bacterium]
MTPPFKAVIACAALLIPLSSQADQDALHEYDVSIAGIGIGDASLDFTQSSNSYAATLLGGFRFLFWTGNAEARSEGVRSETGLLPLAYRSRFKSPSRVFSTEIDFEGNAAARSDWNTEPPLDPEEFGERWPITKADLVGAKDPIASFIIPANSGAEACSRSVKVFSGVVRFDVKLTAGEAEPDGVTPCIGAYQPVSGHRVESDEVDRLRDAGLTLSVFEIAPGLWAPDRLGFKTSLGTLALERRRD